MKHWTRFAFVLLFVPLVASAQFRDLDAAMANLERGFGTGDVQAIVAGLGSEEQVMLQFPGLVETNGFYGRDQASYVLDKLFNKVSPAGFEQVSARKVSSEGQYHITAKWTISVGGRNEARDLYITLRNKDNRWSVVSARTASR